LSRMMGTIGYLGRVCPECRPIDVIVRRPTHSEIKTRTPSRNPSPPCMLMDDLVSLRHHQPHRRTSHENSQVTFRVRLPRPFPTLSRRHGPGCWRRCKFRGASWGQPVRDCPGTVGKRGPRPGELRYHSEIGFSCNKPSTRDWTLNGPGG
jgi:hypothetical protein